MKNSQRFQAIMLWVFLMTTRIFVFVIVTPHVLFFPSSYFTSQSTATATKSSSSSSSSSFPSSKFSNKNTNAFSKAKEKDLYQILGLDKNKKCTTKDIQKAYRKKALLHHPDKVPEHERSQAEIEFKKIGQAYEILSDEKKRKLYDIYGESSLQPNFYPGGGDTAQPFDVGTNSRESSTSQETYFFGNDHGQHSNFFSSSAASKFYFPGAANRNRGQVDLEDIILEDVMRGMMGGFGGLGRQQQHSFFPMHSDPWDASQSNTSPFSSTRATESTMEKTFYCTLEELSRPKGCTKKLKVSFPNSHSTHPKGKNPNQSSSFVYTIHIQPGWKSGTKIKFGPNYQNNGFPPITFVLQEKPHVNFVRQGHDLIYTCTIHPRQAQKGGFQIHIPPLPDGQGPITWTVSSEKNKDKDMTLPIQEGDERVIEKRGMYIKGGPERGNLIVRFHIQAK